MASERFLATVLFTDIVGSTERAAELGDRAWRKLLHEHDSVVRRELRRFGGREVNTAGDAFLATFDRPARAICCAWAIRDAVRDLGIEIRSGLHMGEVEGQEGSLGGIAVHTGARVAALAGAGEVLVSSTVRDSVAGAGFVFEDRGLHVLKGVPGEWRLFAVTSVPETAAEPLPGRLRSLVSRKHVRLAGAMVALLLLLAAGLYFFGGDLGKDAGREAVPTAAAAPGIAVLPFDVRGRGLDVYREGMVDLLSTNLDGVAGLRAIDSRTVLARWRDAVEPPETADLRTALDVARRTGARYALVGSALSSGGGMRLTADVYSVDSAISLGGGQVEGPADSLFGLVDRLSIEILRGILKGRGDELPPVNLARATTSSLPALKAYLEGEVLFRRSDFPGAIKAYERALEADSAFALALSRLSLSYGWVEAVTSDLWAQFTERAARHADRLPEREALLLRASRAISRGTLEGVEPLRGAVQRYPDDAEIWYFLADTYQHLGVQALITREEADRAFARAVELDPSFSPAYIHMIENALDRADSARAATLVETYGRLAPGSSLDLMHRLNLALAFGDSLPSARARAAMDSLATPLLTFSYLWHPRFLALHEEALLKARERPDAFDLTATFLFYNSQARGKIRTALERLNDPLLPQGFAHEGLYTLYANGLPLPADRLEEGLSLTLADTGPDFTTFYAGAYAADRARWSDHADALARLREQARRALGRADTTTARFIDGEVRALEGYALWRRGQREEAVRTLEDARDRVTGNAARNAVNTTVRWWLGKALLEMGRSREAERYFSSFSRSFDFPPEPLSFRYLGTVYEVLEEYEKARSAYELFTLAWREADPELQPLVEETRAAARRLTSVVKE